MLRIPSLDRTAILIIDLQPVFTSSFEAGPFPTQIVSVIEFARATFPPERIIHIRANYVDSVMQPFNRIVNPQIAIPTDIVATSWAVEAPLEPVIVKSTINGFHETSLHEYLRGLNIETILLTGLLTAACVHETAIGGLNRGYQPILIEDACADKTPLRQQQVIDLYKNYLYQTCVLQDLKDFVTKVSSSN